MVIDPQPPLVAARRQRQTRPNVDCERMVDGRTVGEPRGTADLEPDFHRKWLRSEGRRNLHCVEAIGGEQAPGRDRSGRLDQSRRAGRRQVFRFELVFDTGARFERVFNTPEFLDHVDVKFVTTSGPLIGDNSLVRIADPSLRSDPQRLTVLD